MTQQVRIEKFEPHHLLLLDIQEEQKYLLDQFENPRDLYEYGRSLKMYAAAISETDVCAWSAFCGDKCVGCGGILLIDLHVGESWTIFGKEFQELRSRTMIKKIREQLEATKLIRIRANVDEGFDRAERFIKWLGFKYEGLAIKASPNMTNQKMFAKIREI